MKSGPAPAASPKERILSLLPSTTEIVGALGLGGQVVGVTHECDMCPDRAGLAKVLARGAERVTRSGINPHALDQRAIDEAVKTSLASGLSLYTIDERAVRRARPSVVLTQTLCSVCAPDEAEVEAVCRRLGEALADESARTPRVVNLEPTTLEQVAETFVTVAEACGVPRRGRALKLEFEEKLRRLADVVRDAARRPRVLLLEWLDPPFDAGHWVPEQIAAAGGETGSSEAGCKSEQITWETIEAIDPDVILVACCGFDLARNLADVRAALAAPEGRNDEEGRLRAVRAVRDGRLFVLDGNRYFARPSPSLAEGAALIARAAHADDPATIERLVDSGLLPEGGWARVSVAEGRAPVDPGVGEDGAGFRQAHEAACERGDASYEDPGTGFRVFTRVGLLARGRCCGCGCRHCPYSHENVEDKPARIQQPSFLHRRGRRGRVPTARSVLFWSGGKDSLLALRAWIRHRMQDEGRTPGRVLDELALLTTFDADSRIVAHQEVAIADIARQATALDLDLVGVPLHTGTPYLAAVRAGLECLRGEDPGTSVAHLVFGDLHLAHVRTWRDRELSEFGCELRYPLWKTPLPQLLDDLDRSGVPCIVTACADAPDDANAIRTGDAFDTGLVERARALGWDPFGENGEFHTLARVWDCSSARALGVSEPAAT